MRTTRVTCYAMRYAIDLRSDVKQRAGDELLGVTCWVLAMIDINKHGLGFPPKRRNPGTEELAPDAQLDTSYLDETPLGEC
ncbi:MAG: hypothetical protein DRO11_01190 [Methanobacteriota archaeon]|nr:MAG: hypothetical protein DRO11_01190 [Euryarchaeota archaeon]